MDRARVLAALNRRILETFSRRTVAALRAHLPVRLALAHFDAIVALNVAKEVRKDSAVIRAAGDALATGAPPGRETVLGLLEGTKEIDRAFLDQAGALPVRIVIRYEEVAPIRLARIELLLGAGYRILDAWQTAPGLRAALRAAYPEPEFERLLREVAGLMDTATAVADRLADLPIGRHLATLPLVLLLENTAGIYPRCCAARRFICPACRHWAGRAWPDSIRLRCTRPLAPASPTA